MDMNTQDVLEYGHRTFLDAVDGLPHKDWHSPTACGVWSVKDIVAHIASYELLLIDVIHQLLEDEELTPTLDQLFELGPLGFNDIEVDARQGMSEAEVVVEYEAAHVRAMALILHFSEEKCHEVGTLPWYGPEYAFDDFIVYSYYGHKREHSAQIGVYRDQLRAD